ncbi:hypothetical protein [Eisenbergiella sp.]
MELRLSKKIKYLLETFTSEYFAVFVVDFTEDMVEISHVSEPVVPLLSQAFSQSGAYGGFLDYYCKSYVDEKDRGMFRASMDAENVRHMLAQSGRYTVMYHHLFENRECPTEVMIVDVSNAQDGRECVVAARFVEDVIRQQTALKKQDDMVKTLICDYNAIYHIDLDADTYMILQAHNVVNEDLYDYAYRNLPYHDSMSQFVEKMVREEDREMMLKLSDREYKKERFEHEDGYSYRYQVTPQQGMEYFEMRIVRAMSEEPGHHAIMMVRNVDELAREELRAQREIEKVNKELFQALCIAKAANQAKTDFLSRMSHDIRTPMNAILGITLLDGTHLDDKERLKKSLGQITWHHQ